MRRRLLVVAAAGLFCGPTVAPEYERPAREGVGGPIALATQACWGKLDGKAQVEWHGHLRKIDEPARADSVMTSTARSVVQCVADTVVLPVDNYRPAPIGCRHHPGDFAATSCTSSGRVRRIGVALQPVIKEATTCRSISTYTTRSTV